MPGVTVRYTTDGSAPVSEASPLYADSIGFDGRGRRSAFQAFYRGAPLGDGRTFTITPNLARGRPYTLAAPPSPRYPGTGPRTLTDGAVGTLDFHDGLWQGWQGPDLEAVIDLGAATPVASVEGSFQQTTQSWILLPRDFTAWVSDDGAAWKEAGTASSDQPADRTDPFCLPADRHAPARDRGAVAQGAGHQPGRAARMASGSRPSVLDLLRRDRRPMRPAPPGPGRSRGPRSLAAPRAKA